MDDIYETPKFLPDVECERCKGPLRADGLQVTDFKEETGDYIRYTVWGCYMCGHEHRLGSQAYYV